MPLPGASGIVIAPKAALHGKRRVKTRDLASNRCAFLCVCRADLEPI
jgi:hypothetical protein